MTASPSFKLLPLGIQQVLPETSSGHEQKRDSVQYFSEKTNNCFPPPRATLGSQETEAELIKPWQNPLSQVQRASRMRYKYWTSLCMNPRSSKPKTNPIPFNAETNPCTDTMSTSQELRLKAHLQLEFRRRSWDWEFLLLIFPFLLKIPQWSWEPGFYICELLEKLLIILPPSDKLHNNWRGRREKKRWNQTEMWPRQHGCKGNNE